MDPSAFPPGLDACSWLQPDVVRYVFYLVWVCGRAISTTAVMSLLRRTAAGMELAATAEGLEEDIRWERSRRVVTVAAVSLARSPRPIPSAALREATAAVCTEVLSEAQAVATRLPALGNSTPSRLVGLRLQSDVARAAHYAVGDVDVVEVAADEEVEVLALQPPGMSDGAAQRWQRDVYHAAIADDLALERLPPRLIPRSMLSAQVASVHNSSSSTDGSDVEMQGTPPPVPTKRTRLERLPHSVLPSQPQKKLRCSSPSPSVVIVSEED